MCVCVGVCVWVCVLTVGRFTPTHSEGQAGLSTDHERVLGLQTSLLALVQGGQDPE